MATSVDFMEYVCAQLSDCGGAVRYRKMFGEYMVYLNDKPILLVCDNTVFVKPLPALDSLMAGSERGIPYAGAKEHWMLDIDDREKLLAAAEILERVTPLPKPRRKKQPSL